MGSDLRNAPANWQQQREAATAAALAATGAILAHTTISVKPLALIQHLWKIVWQFLKEMTLSGPTTACGAVADLMAFIEATGRHLQAPLRLTAVEPNWWQYRHYLLVIDPDGSWTFYDDNQPLVMLRLTAPTTLTIPTDIYMSHPNKGDRITGVQLCDGKP